MTTRIYIPPPSRKEVRAWLLKRYGNGYWRGFEVPYWNTETTPPITSKRRPYAINRFVENHYKRADLLFEKDNIIWICETEYKPLFSSIGQLKTAKYWLPKCYPNAFQDKRIRLYLFTTLDDPTVRIAAKNCGIRTIIMKNQGKT